MASRPSGADRQLALLQECPSPEEAVRRLTELSHLSQGKAQTRQAA
jgi:hypothetical protein